MGWQSSPLETPTQAMRFTDAHLRWLWVTDSHLVNAGDSRDLNLRAAVDDCNTWRPNAFIHTGDIGDNNPEKVARSFNTLRGCQRPLYTVIGNHDEYEAVAGVPNTAYIASSVCFNRTPFYWTNTITSGDGTLTARCIYLDCNIYDVKASDPTIVNAYHSPGERVGWSAAEPSGGSYRQFTATQTNWVASVLAADTTSQIVLVFSHYPGAGSQLVTDFVTLADKLQADGRPTVIFSGHAHPDAKTYTITSTDTLKTYTIYKKPAMQESGAWCRVEIHLSAGAIVIDTLELHNFTDPGTGGGGVGGSWLVSAPFTSV